MTAFTYRNGVLHAESVPLPAIAAAVETPCYIYAAGQMETNFRAFTGAFHGQDVGICFALKANSNQAVIRTLGQMGAGADVVSGGEMQRALAAGIAPERIVFSGVGKTRAEMEAALAAGIFQINVESLPELEQLSAVAGAMGVEAPVAVRVNPDVDARTHAKIATGRKENKFGIDLALAPEVFRQAAALPGIRPLGVAMHIGSQLTALEPFRAAFTHLADLVRSLREQGHDIRRVDLGGGLGIAYRNEDLPDLGDYARLVQSATGNLGCHVTLEPGRALVGNAGLLLVRVLYVKTGVARRFIIVDGAMNDLIRPTLYEAWHGIQPVREPAADAVPEPFDVVGPICETGDTFARQRDLPVPAAGDLLAVMAAGAYGAVMASSYNSRPLIPEVLVRGDVWAVVRARPSVAELIAADTLPAWLNPA